MSHAAFAPLRITEPSAFGRVAVLYGGESREREVSLKSGQAVLTALQAKGVDAHLVDGVTALLAAQHSDTPFDRVFNILHGGAGENGVLQGALTAMGVPFTGPGVLGTALTLDKIRTKQIWMAEGLPTPKFQRIVAGDGYAERVREAAQAMGLPVFLKPSSEGSSVGVMRIDDGASLDAAIAQTGDLGVEMLMEQLVDGPEYSVPVFDGVALPSIHIQPKQGFYDFEAKYLRNDTTYTTPGLTGEDEAAIGRLAVAGFAAVACTGWGRVDIMRDAKRGFELIEVNTAPGMTATSLVPKSAAVVGVDFEELCWRVLEQTV